ncbi:ribonucleotide-diphosphate reductase subunit alpha, partial [Sphingobacterium shayense]|nr:ribonucleotide-diphosphate reductase subunit alpha [Sphingobacterium shayense]
ISCNLGSLNIATVMDNKRIKETVKTAMRALTVVTDVTNIEMVPTIAKANKELHSVGLGAMNLHGYLAKSFIMYESTEALDFANTFFMMMNYYSLEASMEIAKERNATFTGFEKSAYADGTYFNRYIDREYTPTTDKVKELFAEVHIPTSTDWENLKAQVQEHGIYHAYRLAIAPNQSTSYIMNATASVMPVVDIIEVREYGDSTTYYPMPYLSNDNYFYFKSAYDMDQYKVLKLISVIQRHIDQGVSTILHTNSKDSTRDLAKYYIYAHKLGLKSLYYTRTRKSTVEECISCSA